MEAMSVIVGKELYCAGFLYGNPVGGFVVLWDDIFEMYDFFGDSVYIPLDSFK